MPELIPELTSLDVPIPVPVPEPVPVLMQVGMQTGQTIRLAPKDESCKLGLEAPSLNEPTSGHRWKPGWR